MSIFKQLLLFILIVSLIPVVFRLVLHLLIKLHLLPLLLYLATVKFFFPSWAAAYEVLCIGLLAAIVIATLASWLVPWIRGLIEERQIKDLLLSDIRFAEEQGLSTDQYHFTVKNGVPILEYDK